MGNALVSFNAVAPICLIVLTGMFFKKCRVMTVEFVGAGNAFLYKAIMPVMIFNNVFFAENTSGLNIRFIGYACVAIAVGFALSGLLAARIFPDRRRAASFAQGMTRSNYLVVGLPMATALMGDKCATAVAVLTPFTTSMFAIGASVIFALLQQGGTVRLGKILRTLARTPILLGVAVAIAFKLLNVTLPPFLHSAIKSIASISAPFALLILGAQLDLSALGRNLWPVLACSLGKLLLLSTLLFTPAVLWMDFNQYELVALFFLFFTPGAVNGYFEAIQQGADYEFSGEVVVLSTLLSFVTLFCAILALKQAGVF